MARLLEIAGRKFYLIEHDVGPFGRPMNKHTHLIQIDTDIDSDGNGSTSGFVATDPLDIWPTHEHNIEDFEILPLYAAVGSALFIYSHAHTGDSPLLTQEELRSAKAGEDTADTVDFDFSDEPWFESDIPSTSLSRESVTPPRPANSIDTGVV